MHSDILRYLNTEMCLFSLSLLNEFIFVGRTISIVFHESSNSLTLLRLHSENGVVTMGVHGWFCLGFEWNIIYVFVMINTSTNRRAALAKQMMIALIVNVID